MADYVTAVPAARALPRVSAATLRRGVRFVPVAAILCGQAVLTARLIHVSTASGDEGRYIYAGHQLIRELWQGGGSPYYETYFSGAPVIYPVLAALADHVGGLVAVRIMSLEFMLAATGLLFATGRRLFGYPAGVAAAGLFAGLGLTQDLGALATQDALALLLTATAAYCAVRTGDREPHPSRWLVAVPVALLAANATKYATMVFDPVLIGLAALQVREAGWRRAGQRAVALGLTTAALLTLAVFLAGQAYLNGILFSTLDRKAGSWAVFAAIKVPAGTIVADSWVWVGLVVAAGAAGLAAALAAPSQRRRHGPLLALLVAAGILVTLESLHLHTVESMRKHDDIGVWFSCLAAGYLLARPAAAARGRAARAMLTAVVPLGVLLSGAHYSPLARSTYEAGTSARRLGAFAALKPYLELPSGRYLIGGLDDEQLVYTDGLDIPWYRLVDDVYIKYPVPGRGGDSHGEAPGLACTRPAPDCRYLEGIAGYRAAIRAHWFALISMVGGHGTRQDALLEAAVRHDSGYVLLTRAGGAPTWIYPPAYRRSARPDSGGRPGR